MWNTFILLAAAALVRTNVGENRVEMEKPRRRTEEELQAGALDAVGKLADCNRNTACAEVIAALYHAACVAVSEQALELALLGGVALLHLAAAGLERRLGVLLGRSGGTTDSVASGASSEKKDHIARSRTLPAHVCGTHCTDDGTDLETLGRISRMVDFTHMGGCKTDLVAVA